MNDAQYLKDLLNQGQNEKLELLAMANVEVVAKNVCAMLNGGGGKIIVGVSNEGKVVGIKNEASFYNSLQTYLVKQILPESPITISLEYYGKVPKKAIVIIKAPEGSKQPYIFDSTIYFRRGSTTRKASSKEISALIHERQFAELHWERQINSGATINDLDENLIRKTLIESRKNYRSNFEGDDTLGFLNHFGLYVNGSFTNACVVLFAKKPSKFIPQIRVRLTEYTNSKTDDNLLRDEVIDGNLFHIRDVLENYFQNLGTKSVFLKSEWKRKDFIFPVKALQEGVINALMHRDYSSYSSSVSIGVYPNRIVITNSGNLPDGLKVSDLKKSHQSHPVNPDIAHIVFLNGLIDKLGKGTIKLVEECKNAGLKTPQWKQTSNSVSLTFFAPSEDTLTNDAVSVVNDALNDAQNDALNDAVNNVLKAHVSGKLLKRYYEFVKLLYTNKLLTLKQLTSSLSVSRATMQRDIKLLASHNFIRFKGSDKYREYSLNDALRNKIDALKTN